jgi:hypothetical protein
VSLHSVHLAVETSARVLTTMHPSDILEYFRERVAIMIVDGQRSEAEAVKHAYRVCRSMFGRESLPPDVVEIWAEVMRRELEKGWEDEKK